MKKILIIMLFVLLQSCMTLDVKGRVQNTNETFSGSATGYMSGSGNLKIISSKGSICEGNFVYVTQRQGSGVFNCDDGRSGPFEFVSTGTSGTGQGSLGHQAFTFTFGF